MQQPVVISPVTLTQLLFRLHLITSTPNLSQKHNLKKTPKLQRKSEEQNIKFSKKFFARAGHAPLQPSPWWVDLKIGGWETGRMGANDHRKVMDAESPLFGHQDSEEISRACGPPSSPAGSLIGGLEDRRSVNSQMRRIVAGDHQKSADGDSPVIGLKPPDGTKEQSREIKPTERKGGREKRGRGKEPKLPLSRQISV